MFGDLDKYRSADFLQQTNTGTLLVPGGRYALRVFACIVVSASDDLIYQPLQWQADNVPAMLDRLQADACVWTRPPWMTCAPRRTPRCCACPPVPVIIRMQEPLFWPQCSLNDPKEEPVMKSMQKFVAALLGTALCAVLLATAAFAQGGVAVTLPVSIRTAGADPEPNAAYTLCLQAVDNAPMPDAPRTASTALPCRRRGLYLPADYLHRTRHLLLPDQPRCRCRHPLHL